MLVSLWGHLSYFLRDFHEYLIVLTIACLTIIFCTYYLYKSSLPEKRKTAYVGIIFFIFSLIIIYSGFEAYFRYRFDESDSLGFLNVTGRWYQRHVVYNNFQLRDDKNYSIEKKPGVIRIGVMGDSNAWGYGIKNVENRFSNVLEKKLQNAGYKVEVYNFGVPGLDTWNEINEYHTKAKQFHLDILLWSYFLNDAEPPHSAGTDVLQKAGKQIPGWVTLLSDHSFFFDYLYWRLSAKYATTFSQLRNADIQQYSNPSVFADHKRRIDEFTKELQSNNIKTVVIIFPFMRYFPNYPATSIHEKMHKVFLEDNVTALVDLLPDLKGKNAKDLVVNRYDTHPNEFVHALAASKLYNVIVPLLDKRKDGTFIK